MKMKFFPKLLYLERASIYKYPINVATLPVYPSSLMISVISSYLIPYALRNKTSFR